MGSLEFCSLDCGQVIMLLSCLGLFDAIIKLHAMDGKMFMTFSLETEIGYYKQ